MELQQAMKVGKDGLKAQLEYLADGNGEKVGVEEGKESWACIVIVIIDCWVHRKKSGEYPKQQRFKAIAS